MGLERGLEGRHELLKFVEGHTGEIQELRRAGLQIGELYMGHRWCLQSWEAQYIINRDNLSYHDRRTTGRKVASPGLVLSGSVCVIAAAATRLHTYSAAELAPENVKAWQELRQARETRRQQRTLRRRFRRDPVSYLAKLEMHLLQLILPP